MRVWHEVSEIPRDFGPTVVTIGNFDGVHRGHRHVIECAHALAEELGSIAVVAVTFDPHPMRVIMPDRAPKALSSLEERIALLGDAGADAVLVLSFTAELAKVSPEAFVTGLILDTLRAAGVVVGDNFRFGHRAAGNVELLTALCSPRGVTVVGLPLDGSHGKYWSSSYVRACVAEGDVARAAEVLGRQFSIKGYVVRGEQRGRELGYPTANVPVTTTRDAMPADGVYAGWLRRLDQADTPYLPAAISVGTNPTFDGVERRVESYVLDRTDLELYGALVEVTFAERLRGMVKFDAIADLVRQMSSDVDLARALLTTPPDSGG